MVASGERKLWSEAAGGVCDDTRGGDECNVKASFVKLECVIQPGVIGDDVNEEGVDESCFDAGCCLKMETRFCKRRYSSEFRRECDAWKRG